MSAMSDLDADLRNLVGNPYIHTESVDKLKAEIERLRFLASGQDDPHSVALARAADEIERLREALRPFASLFLYPDDLGFEPSEDIKADEDWDEDANDMVHQDCFVLRRDIRKARAALGEKE